MPEIAAALVGATALVSVTLMALWLLKWGVAPSEMTDATRQRFVGCGFVLVVLVVLGSVVAFVIMVARLSKGL